MKVLVISKSFGKLSRKLTQRLQDAGFKVYGNKKGRLLNEEGVVETIQGTDTVILETEVFNRNVIDHADKLKIVPRCGMGLDRIDVEYLKEKGIVLQIARNANTSSVANHITGLMLSLCHNTTRSDANIRSHVWKKPIAKDLHQSTVGIPGSDVIRKVVARRLKGFGCHILAFDSHYDGASIREYGMRKVGINEVASSNDFLTLHLPAPAEFSPLLDAKVLSEMKKDAVIINTARVEFIDRQALYDTLHNGWLYGYGSDVCYMEPGSNEELTVYEDTVLTPHIVVSSEGAVNHMSDITVDHILAYFGCQQPLDN